MMRISNRVNLSDRSLLRLLALAVTILVAIMALRTVGSSFIHLAILSAAAIAIALIFARHESLAVARAWESGMQLAMRDEATQLPTAPFADHFVATEFAAAERGREVTIVLLGFDDFEQYTRLHGPAAADAAIRHLGLTLRRLTRRMNLSARYGWRAETFLSVLSDADAGGAEIFVRRVRNALADVSDAPQATISAGIVEFDPSFCSPEEFVQQAERALAEARADGRGGTSVHRSIVKQHDETRWLKAL